MDWYVWDRFLTKVDFLPDGGRTNFILFFVFNMLYDSNFVLADRKL